MRTVSLCAALVVLSLSAAEAKIALPKPQEFTLSNGLSVRVISRHELPLFSMQLVFRAGSIFDPAGQEGLASLTSDMLMRGTKSRTARQIAEDVAFGGGTLSNEAGYESAALSGEFLPAQGEKAVEILADLVLHSTFSVEEFDKTKALVQGQLGSRRENPSLVANDAIWSTILKDSPYGHFTGGTSETVSSLTRDDVVAFAKARYTPDNALLVVCGDVKADQVKKWVNKHLGSWKGKAASVPPPGAFAPIEGRQVILYDKQDATQTQIRIGSLGLPLGHADFPALEVARTVYGGSFASRLMDEIRVNRGLSYGVSYRSSSQRPGGVVYVTTFTKNATVGEVLDIVLAEAGKMQTAAVSDSELTDGANYRAGTYPLDFETNDDLAQVFASMWLNDLSRAYYEDYQEQLRAVKPPAAMAVAQKYFPGEHFRLVLVGKAEEVLPQVEKYGPVKVLPFSSE